MASSIRSVSYDLADHGVGKNPSAKPDEIKAALKKAVDAISEDDLRKGAGWANHRPAVGHGLLLVQD